MKIDYEIEEIEQGYESKNLFEKISELINLRIELVKVNFTEKSSSVASKVALMVLAVFLGAIGLFFLGFALAAALNYYLHSQFTGFILTGILFMVISAVLFTAKFDKFRNFLSFYILKMLDEE